jgi:hypothetical protein
VSLWEDLAVCVLLTLKYEENQPEGRGHAETRFSLASEFSEALTQPLRPPSALRPHALQCVRPQPSSRVPLLKSRCDIPDISVGIMVGS